MVVGKVPDDHVGAARRAQIGERFLQRVETGRAGHPLDGLYPSPLALESEHEAGQDRLTVEQDRAGSTLAELAAVLGAREPQVLAQHFEQCLVVVDERVDGLLESMFEMASEQPADFSRTSRGLKELGRDVAQRAFGLAYEAIKAAQ